LNDATHVPDDPLPLPDIDRPWSIEEVSTYLRIPVQTLYYWRKKRTGPPASRIGRHLRYDPAQVRAWFRNQAA